MNLLTLKPKHRPLTLDHRKWPPLAAPVLVNETQAIMRAQSLLSGTIIGACPPLTYSQARDVLKWAGVPCES